MLVANQIVTDGVVVLIPLATDDAPEWLAGEDEEQLRWFQAPRPSQLSDVQQFVTSCQESWRSLGSHRHWAIRRVDSLVLLGGVDVRALENDQVNLSYVVFPPFLRQGVARRASLRALTYASTLMGATTALIRMLPRNVSSRNLALGIVAHYLREEPSDGGEPFRVFGVELPLA
jgi:RimJ/RimL family protein N-acetyltransferase